MTRKRAFFCFLLSVGVCSLFAIYLPFSESVVSSYQEKSVDTTILKYGETGKILKDLNLILPVEKRSRLKGPGSNVTEVIERATKDRRKWVLLDKYKKYQTKGIFCYFEIETKGLKIPFAVRIQKGGKWEKHKYEIKDNRKILLYE